MVCRLLSLSLSLIASSPCYRYTEQTRKRGKRKKEADVQVEKYDQGHFGACPRVFCHATHVLPCGRADIPGLDTIKLYCPNCGDIYSPPSSKYASVDGESFLSPRLFRLTFHSVTLLHSTLAHEIRLLHLSLHFIARLASLDG